MIDSHGQYKINVEGCHIHTQLFDAFNEVGVSQWINAMKDAIAGLSGQPFTILVNEKAATGATPGALKLANEYNEWLNDQTLVAKAVVYSNAIYKAIDELHLPARKRQNIKFFDDVSLAQNWLKEELAANSH